MQDKKTILFGAVLGAVIALLGSAALSSSPFGTAETASIYPHTGYMMGHITLTATDIDGNIISYVQTDNRVVDQGEACALKITFGDSAGGSADCSGATTAVFDVIALGISSTVEADNDVALASETSATGLVRATATTTTITDDPDGTSGASVLISETFQNTSASTVTVTESGLFNSTSTTADGMFARQVFTGIVLNDQDSLTVDWTITFDGVP